METATPGIRAILDGITFPAPRWLLIAQAQYSGAPAVYVSQLARLPATTYQSLSEVMQAVAQEAAPDPGGTAP